VAGRQSSDARSRRDLGRRAVPWIVRRHADRSTVRWFLGEGLRRALPRGGEGATATRGLQSMSVRAAPVSGQLLASRYCSASRCSHGSGPPSHAK
jgi:hypothetical protein